MTDVNCTIPGRKADRPINDDDDEHEYEYGDEHGISNKRPYEPSTYLIQHSGPSRTREIRADSPTHGEPLNTPGQGGHEPMGGEGLKTRGFVVVALQMVRKKRL